MSEPIRIGLVGSTGLVGRTLMEELVGKEDFRLTAVSRREVPLPQGARMEMRLADPGIWDEVMHTVKPEVLVCALGTTMRKSGGDEAAFRAVDQELVMHVARAAKEAGTWHFIFVSSVGAAPASTNLYLRVKGEVEAELTKLRFKRLDILRPGLLRGIRQNDLRPVEGLGRVASPLADMFLHGDKRRFRSISAQKLVHAILGLALEKAGGRFIHEYDSMMRAIRRYEMHEEARGDAV